MIIMITITLVPREQAQERMDGWRYWEIHLPLRPKGVPNQEAEQHMRRTLPTNTDSQCDYTGTHPKPSSKGKARTTPQGHQLTTHEVVVHVGSSSAV